LRGSFAACFRQGLPDDGDDDVTDAGDTTDADDVTESAGESAGGQ